MLLVHAACAVRLQERLENAAANRFERAFNHNSKRYEKEVREVGHVSCC